MIGQVDDRHNHQAKKVKLKNKIDWSLSLNLVIVALPYDGNQPQIYMNHLKHGFFIAGKMSRDSPVEHLNDRSNQMIDSSPT